MKTVYYIVVTLCIVAGSFPASAHKLTIPFKKPVFPSLSRVTKAPLAAKINTAINRKVLQQQARLLSRQVLPAPLNKAMLTLKENHRFLRHLRRAQTSAFVIEEIYQGQRFLWGVSTAHSDFINSTVLNPQTEQRLPIPFALAGGLADIAIFELPASLSTQVIPLRLAANNPKLGDVLYSVGFFDNAYHLETNRVVQQEGPNRIVTSLQIDRTHPRSGACGGPLLNKEGEVVAVHAGSHNKQDLGYAIPVAQLHTLLQAYHQGQLPTQQLVFRGHPIGTISFDQYIQSVRVYQGNTLLREIKTYLRENKIDYAHLETFLDSPDADRLEFTIVNHIFPSLQQRQSFQAKVLSYNLLTGKTKEKQSNFRNPIYKRAINKLKKIIPFLSPKPPTP